MKPLRYKAVEQSPLFSPLRPLETEVRFFLVACGVLLALAGFFEHDLLELILPLFRWELAALDDSYGIVQRGLLPQGADSVIRLDVTLRQMVVVGDHMVMPNPRGRASAWHGRVFFRAGWRLVLAWAGGIGVIELAAPCIAKRTTETIIAHKAGVT